MQKKDSHHGMVCVIGIRIKKWLLNKINRLGATRQGWSEGKGGGDTFGNSVLSSSGCEAHPAKAEPGGSEVRPCAVAGNRFGDA